MRLIEGPLTNQTPIQSKNNSLFLKLSMTFMYTFWTNVFTPGVVEIKFKFFFFRILSCHWLHSTTKNYVNCIAGIVLKLDCKIYARTDRQGKLNKSLLKGVKYHLRRIYKTCSKCISVLYGIEERVPGFIKYYPVHYLFSFRRAFLCEIFFS